MTLPDVTATARARLSHWWELNGQGGDPVQVIRRIAIEMEPRRRDVQGHLEDVLLDDWALLCTEEGENDDYLA